MKNVSINVQIAKVYKTSYSTYINEETVEDLFNPILEDLEDGDYIELEILATIWDKKDLKKVTKDY